MKDWYKTMAFYQIWIRSFYDGNGDGILDVSDVSFFIDYILTEGNNSSETGDGIDANGDGKVDVTDLTTLIDMVLTRF